MTKDGKWDPENEKLWRQHIEQGRRAQSTGGGWSIRPPEKKRNQLD